MSPFLIMQTIILAAGKGTRFGKITKKTPKSLLPVLGKPILQYAFESLPPSVKEVILVIGHFGDQIKNRFGDKFGNIKIKYVENKELNGTAGALWAAKPFLAKEKFLVLNGDDIYSKKELLNLVKAGWAFGLYQATPPSLKYISIKLDENKNIVGSNYPKNMSEKILLATGAYVLDQEIFKYKPVPIGNGKEYGLPQTILTASKKVEIKGILMKKWIQINCLEDIQKAEKILK